MDDEHRDILRHYRVIFDKDLEPEELINHMTRVLSAEDEDKIKAPSTRLERVYRFLDILSRRGGGAFQCFLEALDKAQPHLADFLRQGEERVTSANLRQQLKETKDELEKEKAKNITILALKEELRRIQVEQLEILHEKIMKTEVNLKKHFEDVLKKKAKDIADQNEVYPNSRRSSLNGYIAEQSYPYRLEEDENGNIDLEKLNMELQKYRQKEEKLESECNKLRDKVKLLESAGTSNVQDRSCSPLQQAATIAALQECATCKNCKDLENKYEESTREIQRLMETKTENENKLIQTFEGKYKALSDDLKKKQAELRKVNGDVEALRKKTESKQKKLDDLRKSKTDLQREKQQLLEEQERMSKFVEETKKRAANEMAGLRKIADKAQKESHQLKAELEKWKSLPGKVFNFQKEFGNGVIHTFIADSKRTRRDFPFTAKRSSDAYGDATDIFSSFGIHSCTENKEHSWWQIDLGEDFLLFPNHYDLRHGCENGLEEILHWKLEGSRDGNNWKVLKEHKTERWWLPKKQGYPFYTGSWPIEGRIDAVRYLRIYQTGKNAAKGHALYLSGIEFYGVLLHMGDEE